MAKTGRRRYYRRYNRYSYYRWRRYAKYNYLNAKIDFSGDIVFPTQAGQPVFSGNNAASMLFSNLLYGSGSEFTKYSIIFMYYRLKGIRMEFTPSAGNASLATITHTKPVYVGFNMDNASENTGGVSGILASFANSDKAVMLNPLQKTAKYWSLYGGQDDYKLCNSVSGLSGLIGVYTSENATDNSGPAWSYRITLYILYKSART